MRRFSYLIFFLTIKICLSNDFEKYRPLREQCQRAPSNAECLKIKTKFLQLVQKCQSITTPQQRLLCEEVKIKLCSIFPTTCGQTTKPVVSTTKRKITKKKLTPTTTTTTTTMKAKPIITTATTTTEKSKINSFDTLTNEEFAKVPFDPEELRTRGDYCIRHGKEKKCQQLLNNLKTTYSTCGKKKSEIKPETIECHSFQTHLCKAFPKFPPCLKKTSN
ncbi:hypothetical protein I4U23_021737 [Adineta vaga]|nr:hypothetical protein I4U23_021737 [Adineta vaga]